MNNFFKDRPVFIALAVDASGSMEPFQDDVIIGHKLMLDSFRESDKCLKGVLYFSQYLFSDKVLNLHPFLPIAPYGEDEIVKLTSVRDKN